jgi:hypothetical protein
MTFFAPQFRAAHNFKFNVAAVATVVKMCILHDLVVYCENMIESRVSLLMIPVRIRARSLGESGSNFFLSGLLLEYARIRMPWKMNVYNSH